MIIIRYRELSLKGNNRSDFERFLKNSIKDCLKKNKVEFEKVLRLHGRILVLTNNECPQLKYVSGISSFSYAEECPQNFEEIKEHALKYYTEGTFRISCQRMEDFYMSSQELEREVGAFVVEKTQAKVKLKDPDVDICIEIFNNHAYLFSNKLPGVGGIPVDPETEVVLILQNEDSVKAGIKVVRRGCSLNIFKEKDIDYSELKDYEYGFRIKELESIPKDAIVVVSDTLETIKEYTWFALRPMI